MVNDPDAAPTTDEDLDLCEECSEPVEEPGDPVCDDCCRWLNHLDELEQRYQTGVW